MHTNIHTANLLKIVLRSDGRGGVLGSMRRRSPQEAWFRARQSMPVLVQAWRRRTRCVRRRTRFRDSGLTESMPMIARVPGERVGAQEKRSSWRDSSLSATSWLFLPSKSESTCTCNVASDVGRAYVNTHLLFFTRYGPNLLSSDMCPLRGSFCVSRDTSVLQRCQPSLERHSPTSSPICGTKLPLLA